MANFRKFCNAKIANFRKFQSKKYMQVVLTEKRLLREKSQQCFFMCKVVLQPFGFENGIS